MNEQGIEFTPEQQASMDRLKASLTANKNKPQGKQEKVIPEVVPKETVLKWKTDATKATEGQMRRTRTAGEGSTDLADVQMVAKNQSKDLAH
jgi:hypothetical protein